MQLSKALEGYKTAALAEGYLQLTLINYPSALGTLIEYLGNKEIQEVTSDDLHGFMFVSQLVVLCDDDRYRA